VAEAVLTMEKLEFSDIQGIIQSAYKDLPCAAYLLCEVIEANAARAWLRRMTPTIKNAEGPDKVSSVNIAFTAAGLRALGLDTETLASFSFAFTEGMTPEYRARVLGDQGDNHPSSWIWGGPTTRVIHILLMIFANDEHTLRLLVGQTQLDLFTGGLNLLKKLEAGRQSDDQREHFGFLDGVGQPVIEGSGNKDRQVRRTGHASEIKPGEFILGYINEHGYCAQGPVTNRDPTHLLHRNLIGQADLGRNGTYLVFRHIQQHVARFWHYLDSATRRPSGESDPTAREWLGAKFVGRWPSGAPLILADKQDDTSLSQMNNFGYRDQDPHGFKCPVGAHIRRANPRDALGSDAHEAIKSVRRHRLLRRGRSYGSRQANPMIDDGEQRGLFFIAINADLERQFEFVQQTWINNPDFAGLQGEVDPLVGKGAVDMTVQAEPVRHRFHNLLPFVTVRGGAYFFVPGLKAMNYLATLPHGRMEL
jgi:Dyp-type peroxidase family